MEKVETKARAWVNAHHDIPDESMVMNGCQFRYELEQAYIAGYDDRREESLKNIRRVYGEIGENIRKGRANDVDSTNEVDSTNILK